MEEIQSPSPSSLGSLPQLPMRTDTWKDHSPQERALISISMFNHPKVCVV